MSFAMIFYSYKLYGFGGFSEEYGAIFLILSVVFHVRFWIQKNSKALVLAGFFGVLAVLCKETYVISSLPWVFVLLFGKRFKPFVNYLIGATVALAPFVLYLLLNNGFTDFYKYLIYGFQYGDFVPLSVVQKVQIGLSQYLEIFSKFGIVIPFLPVLGLAAFWSAKPWIRKIAFIFYAQFLLEFLVICLSGYGFGHYYLQMVFSFSFLTFIGVHCILDRLDVFQPKLAYVVVLGILFWTGINVDFLNTHGPSLKITDREQNIIKTTNELLEPNSSVYVDDVYLSYLYLEQEYFTTSFIPVPVFHFFMVSDAYSDSRIQRFIRSLVETPNDYIITSNRPITDMYPELIRLKQDRYDLIYTGPEKTKAIKIWKLKED